MATNSGEGDPSKSSRSDPLEPKDYLHTPRDLAELAQHFLPGYEEFGMTPIGVLHLAGLSVTAVRVPRPEVDL